MRKTFRACALVLALGYPTFAGIIHTPEPEPTPTGEITQGDSTVPLDGTMQIYKTDALTEAVLNALESVLSLF